MSKPDYSIIIPVYNSSQMLEELHQRLQSALNTFTPELIFIDDNSSDESWNVLKSLKTKNPATLKIIRLTENVGQQRALLCGLQHATGEFILTMDDDLQHPPEEIIKLIETMMESNTDLVYGIATENSSGPNKIARRILKHFNKYGKWSSFRLLKKQLAEQICALQTSPFNIDQAAYKYTDKIVFCTIKHSPRRIGKSGYSFVKLFSAWFRILILKLNLPVKNDKVSFRIKEQFL
jgi:glycosyltransferase involved in cell wall biosynthesis